MNPTSLSTPVDISRASQTVPRLSIVIPVFNEASRVEHCLVRLDEWIADRDDYIEIIVVDDGSTDATVEIADRIASDHTYIRVMREKHLGKANAVLAGLKSTQGAFAGFCDVDLATPLATWDECRRAFDQGADVAIASREGKGAIRVGEPWYRHVMGRAFNVLIRLLLLPRIDDTQCGFKFFSRKALIEILPRCQLYRNSEVVARPRVTAFDVELLYIARRLNLKIAVIPITWTYGEHTKVNPLTDTIQNLGDVMKVRWNGWRGKYK